MRQRILKMVHVENYYNIIYSIIEMKKSFILNDFIFGYLYIVFERKFYKLASVPFKNFWTLIHQNFKILDRLVFKFCEDILRNL